MSAGSAEQLLTMFRRATELPVLEIFVWDQEEPR